MPIALESPLNLRSCIEESRKRARPGAVDRRLIESCSEFVVSMVCGPSQRKDYHISPFEELFLQVEGELVLRLRDDDGVVSDVVVREGELFALPANVPHSPQRAAGTVGLVVERRRPSVEDDTLRFYCDRCNSSVFEESFSHDDAETELSDILSRFWDDATMRTCRFCGTVVQPPSKTDAITPSPAPAAMSRAKTAARAATARPAKPAAKPTPRRAPIRGR